MRAFARMSLVVCTLAAAVIAWGADTYEIDPVHSNIGFTVRHLGLSHVRGKFTDFAGTITGDENNISDAATSVTIKVASIDTGNAKRDEHLRSPEFFDATKYPEIHFASKSVQKKGDGYVLVGDLTMHGVTKEVSIPFTITGKVTDPMGKVRAGAEGSTTINRQDFKISFSKLMDTGALMVGNDVKVELLIEAVKK